MSDTKLLAGRVRVAAKRGGSAGALLQIGVEPLRLQRERELALQTMFLLDELADAAMDDPSCVPSPDMISSVGLAG